MHQQAKHLYAFGPFRLDSHERVLRRDGQPVALAPKAVDILLVLVQNTDNLVDKDDLMKRVWPDAFVEEGNLTKNIFVLRKALGSRDDGLEYIETVPRRGYRFADPVETWSEDAERTEVVPGGPLRNQIPAPEPGRIERIDRGKGYALARQPEPVWDAPDRIAPSAPAPPVVGGLSSQEVREADTTGIKPRLRRWLRRSLAAALAVIAALAVAWVLLPQPVPRVVRTAQLTRFGRVEPLARSVTDGTRLYFVERRGEHYSLAQVPIEGGEPVPITTPFPNTSLLDVSPSHSELLVGSIAAGEEVSAVWILPTSGGSPRRLGDVMAQDAAWSPDGQRIVYASGPDLYLVRPDGSESRKLVATAGVPHYPRWSPDGHVLRFALSDLTTHVESQWEVSAEGRNLHRLLPGWRESPSDWGDGESGGDWTPDGKYFIFRSVRAHMVSIWAIRERAGFLRQSSSAPILLTTTDSYLWTTSVAGDGKRLVFGAGKDDRELERYDARLNQFVPYLSGVSARWASFSKDGPWVAYVTVPGFVLWRSRLNGSDRLQLTFPPAGSGPPRWSPDSNHIGVRGLGIGGISVIPADGGNPEAVREQDGVDDPEWAPDGDSLLFDTRPLRGGAEAWALYRLNLKTRQVSTLPRSQGLRAPAYSPDGRYVAAVSTNPSNRLMLFDVHSQRWSWHVPLGFTFRPTGRAMAGTSTLKIWVELINPSFGRGSAIARWKSSPP